MSCFAPCALFHLFPVILSQAVFHQTPAVQTVSVGSSVKFHCHTDWLAYGAVTWYKRQHREQLRHVYIVAKHMPADGRFSGQVNEESTVYSLVIEGVQTSDSGVYYCAAKAYSTMPLVFGNGSKLLITGPPAIFLLTPPPDEIRSLERVALMCLARGVSPESSPIRWNVSGLVTEGRTDSGIIDPDGSYSVRSYISVSAETWSGGAVCTCSVQTNTTGILTSESVSYQRESLPLTVCRLQLYGSSSAALLLLAMVIITAGKSCRIRQSGSTISDQEFTDSRPRHQEKETLYARLALNADPTL